MKGIHWVIVGGESGPGSRFLDPTWVKSIQAQCKTASVPFFFKQWGGVRKHETGRKLDGRVYSEFPHRPETPVPSADQRRAYLKEIEAFATVA